MYPQSHFLFPFLIGLILTKFNFFSWKLTLVSSLLAVFVDIDHLIKHAFNYKRKKFSFKSAWNNVKYQRYEGKSFIHFWPGIFLFTFVFIILFFFSQQLVLVLALAYYSHLILDHINHLLLGRKFKLLKFDFCGFLVWITSVELMFDVILMLGIVLMLFQM